MRCFIVVHDELVELSFKHFHFGISYGLGSFMGHPKCYPNILGQSKPSTLLNFSLSIDEVRMEIACVL
jgi:hypothetical protein